MAAILSTDGRLITECYICGAKPSGADENRHVVMVTYNDDQTTALLTYYPAEVALVPAELLGLTRDQALDLYRQKAGR